MAARLDSYLSLPPDSIFLTFFHLLRITICSISRLYRGLVTIAISSMRLLLSKTLTVCSMTVFPATLKNCLGVPSPEREPTPPASITAMFLLICQPIIGYGYFQFKINTINPCYNPKRPFVFLMPYKNLASLYETLRETHVMRLIENEVFL